MNKSLLTNAIALMVVIAGFVVPASYQPLVLNTGLFALSGGVTNWLAIHMLFERIPGFYGSGVIPARFEEFKSGIKTLVMEQFFTRENLDSFFNKMAKKDEDQRGRSIMDKVTEAIDFNTAFDSLVDVIMGSSFAGMLSMVGGANALAPLKEPFVEKMHEFLAQISEDQDILDQVQQDSAKNLLSSVEQVVDQRLDELTPQLVKEIIQEMIKKHLGWLVVWGGVIGGIIGLVTTHLLL